MAISHEVQRFQVIFKIIFGLTLQFRLNFLFKKFFRNPDPTFGNEPDQYPTLGRNNNVFQKSFTSFFTNDV